MVRGQWGNLEFLMTTECQDLGLTSHPKDGAFYSIVSPSLYWGVRTRVGYRLNCIDFDSDSRFRFFSIPM